MSPETRVLALSAYDDAAVAAEMLAAGAVGYIIKGQPIEEIVEAIKRAGRGQSSLSAELAKGVFDELARSETSHREAEQTLRESEKMLLALLESAPDAFVNLDASGNDRVRKPARGSPLRLRPRRAPRRCGGNAPARALPRHLAK